MAFLLLLERLTPEERAVLVLRDVFDVAYAEIADTLGRTEAACRQLVHRARTRLREVRPQPVPTRNEYRPLLERMLSAIAAGDQDRLVRLLAPNAILISDGGGKVRAARNVIRSAARVARFLLGVAPKLLRGLSHEITPINGDPGVVRRRAGQVHSTLSIAADAGQIRAVYIVLNPDKLQRVGAARQAASSP